MTGEDVFTNLIAPDPPSGQLDVLAQLPHLFCSLAQELTHVLAAASAL